LRRAGRTLASASASIHVLGRGGEEDTLGVGPAAELGGIRRMAAPETNGH
jgi:hypothetical protein